MDRPIDLDKCMVTKTAHKFSRKGICKECALPRRTVCDECKRNLINKEGWTLINGEIRQRFCTDCLSLQLLDFVRENDDVTFRRES